ncbi:MAG: hypothetical protein IJ091_09670 [Oscillospiraceae bacterium]|nr:hypothetical protein [Oscillospiraceae bacterium]
MSKNTVEIPVRKPNRERALSTREAFRVRQNARERKRPYRRKGVRRR